jgi:ABC-type histidine transport system ATPase subunit
VKKWAWFIRISSVFSFECTGYITLAPRLVKKTDRMQLNKKMSSVDGWSDRHGEQLSPSAIRGQQHELPLHGSFAMEPRSCGLMNQHQHLIPNDPRVLSIMRKLTKMGLTMLIVTHEMKFAQEVSNRVFFMDDGGIYEEGTPAEIFENPQKEKTKAFIRRLNVFSYEIHSIGFDLIAMNALIEVFSRRTI